MQKISKIFKRFFNITFGIDSLREDIGARVVIIENFSLILIITALVLVIATLFNLFTGSTDTSEVPSLIVAVMLLFNMLMLRYTKNVRLISSLSVLVIFVFFAYLILAGFDAGKASFWFFLFIIFSFLLTGIHQGIVWIVSLLFVLFLLMRLSDIGFIDIGLNQETIRSLFLTLGVTTALIYLYEKSIQKYVDMIKHDEVRLREQNAQYSALISSIGDGLLATDKKGKVKFVNQPAVKMIGADSLMELEKIIGSDASSAFPILDKKGKVLPKAEHPIYRVLKTGTLTDTTSQFESYQSRRKDGTVFPVSMTVAPIMVQGQISGTVEVFRDMTSQNEIEKAKNEFVSLTSHQLRTPITTINWYIEMLEQGKAGKLTKDQKQMLKSVREGSDLMNELVGSLLDISRLELGSIPIENEEIDLVRLTDLVIKDVDPTITRKNMKVKRKYSHKSIKMLGDRKFIKMMIENLVSNALKYTPEKGHVNVELKQIKQGGTHYGKKIEDAGILIRIKDNGYGIPKHQQERIFTKLFRADNARKLDVEGTGLGLYIVYLIVHKHHGLIWFKSEEDKGSEFYVFLPDNSDSIIKKETRRGKKR